mmetsp:Transcript_59636/g.105991  ORF Transcript_59636/g.105991 Transcript_59636/m.105991 type:complete len:488 (+) Transcript_59636:1-1464(+)
MAEGSSMASEEAAADCPYINAYCRDKHNSVVQCFWTPQKGRILRSCRSFKQGEIIFREPPLHIVKEEEGNQAFQRLKELCTERPKTFEYEPLWYWAALSSLTSSSLPADASVKPVTEDQQRKLLLLYHNEVKKSGEAAELLVQELKLDKCEAKLLESLLQVWILNCFEHSDEPLGYSTYFMSSFMSHSCFPNAVWHYDEDDFILRARTDIEANDEVTVSYLSEDGLFESTEWRRTHLKDSKHFICSCVRCTAVKDPCRGFRCPSCFKVSLSFGPADGDKVEVGVQEMTSRVCEHCGIGLQPGQAAMLCGEEKLFESKIHQAQLGIEQNDAHSGHKEQLMQLVKDAQRAEKSLSQHFLLDKAWQIIVELYDRSCMLEDAQAVMRKRLIFQAKAYPGLNGTNAWALEAYADMMMRQQKSVLDPSVKVADEPAARKLARSVPKVYSEALRVLRFMFGEDHVYFEQVNRKARELDTELERYLGKTDKSDPG